MKYTIPKGTPIYRLHRSNPPLGEGLWQAFTTTKTVVYEDSDLVKIPKSSSSFDSHYWFKISDATYSIVEVRKLAVK